VNFIASGFGVGEGEAWGYTSIVRSAANNGRLGTYRPRRGGNGGSAPSLSTHALVLRAEREIEGF
jgi:hypothetical protein